MRILQRKNDAKINMKNMQDKGEIVIYQNRDNGVALNVRLEDENVWLTQANLVDLYQSSKANVSEHIKHIFEEGELEEISVVRKFRTTAADGKNYDTAFCILCENAGEEIEKNVKSRVSRSGAQSNRGKSSFLCDGFSLGKTRVTRKRGQRSSRSEGQEVAL